MPQESLRSVVYRSFVTCDDPRGVVEGKTIRISKTDSTKMGSRRIESQTQPKIPKEKEKMSSCKRATRVLDLDKTPSSYQVVEVKNGAQKLNQVIDSWSRGVCFEGRSKDIAKDLLKGALDLQESLMMLGKLQEASCMARFKNKQQETPSEDLVGRIGSNRFENCRNYDMGSQRQRNPADGSSRDCYEELRDVIRDGLSRQNLLPNKSYEESAFAGKRKSQLSPDIASTSSSRSSSMVYSSHEFTSSESFSSRATEEKLKGSNLIAKLMGLEEFPSKALPSSPRKQLDSRRIVDQKKPVFEIDLPKARKPQFFVQKLDREQMTLDEIIEMMQSKGLLRSNKHQLPQTSNSDSDKRFRDDVPPIVLMKPQHIGPEKAVDNRKVKADANSIRKLHQEKAKAEDKAVKTRGKLPSNKPKASVPVVTKPQRNQEMEKKTATIEKISEPVRRKPVATENGKSMNSVSKSTSPKQVKPQRSALPNPTSKRTSSSTLSTNKSSNQKKNRKIEKPVQEPLPTIIHEVLQIDAPNEEEPEDSEVMIKEIDNRRQQSLCEAIEEDSYCIGDTTTDVDHSETINNHEESGVSDTSERKAGILKTICSFQDSEPANSELFRDCVNEFLEHENLRKIPNVHPLLQTSMFQSRFCISEDQLMRKITNGVENLSSYSKISQESSDADIVYGLLERDFCWSTMGGAWSTGWKDGCTLNEVEEVVLDLEKMILRKLIDDAYGTCTLEGRGASF